MSAHPIFTSCKKAAFGGYGACCPDLSISGNKIAIADIGRYGQIMGHMPRKMANIPEYGYFKTLAAMDYIH